MPRPILAPAMSTGTAANRVRRSAKGVLRRLGLEVRRVDGPGSNGATKELEPLPAPGADVVARAERSFSAEFPLAPDLTLSTEELERRITSYYWHYSFRFGNRYIEADWEPGKGLHGRHYRRYLHLFPALLSAAGGSLEGKTVLDVGCNCGFWSIQARLAGATSVLGVEASAENVEQARFIKEVTGLDGIDFEVASAYDLSKERHGEFDVVLYFGLLYHLEHPVLGLERLAEVTRELSLVDTTIVRDRGPVCHVIPDAVHEQNFSNRLAMVPSRTAVARMLRHAGFARVLAVPRTIEPLPADYASGTREAYVARKP
jgi:2-polyprenyl-3-methyl-5-hydroxy-6-metoxy-1,4-benzoquinol methylase